MRAVNPGVETREHNRLRIKTFQIVPWCSSYFGHPPLLKVNVLKAKRLKPLSILILLIVSMFAPVAMAKPGSDKGLHKGKDKQKDKHLKAAYNGLNKGNGAKHLYLYEKDPETWEIVENGSWGKITYIPKHEKFIFNGHRLEPGVAYDLINYAPGVDWSMEPYPNPWPGDNSTEIASGLANEGGNVHLKGSWNGTTGEETWDIDGKVWLVPSYDFLLGTGMIGWNPTEYLFEYDLLPK